MNKLESLLNKYASNFLLIDEITINNKIVQYFNFHNIVIVTDTNLLKFPAINSVIIFFERKF